MILVTILTFIIILGLLVFVHELGHFLMAKRAGMKVEEFGFGFPPRIFGIKKGGTIYSINWIPLGGFVKILGENGDTSEEGSFGTKGFWARFGVLIAGVTMNIIFAWLLIAIGMTVGLPTAIGEGDTLPANAHVGPAQVSILEVRDDSPASAAGFKIGDSIFKINGQELSSIEQTQELTKENAGKPTEFEIHRGNEVFNKTVTPRVNPPSGEGALGVALSSVAKVSYPWYSSAYRAVGATVNLGVATIAAFGQIIVQWIHHEPVSQALSGPVGIAVLTRDVAQLGLIYLLQCTAVLSINLAIINAVPFPALDGGRILFLVIEKLRGKKMNPQAEGYANAIGFMLLILLMVFVTIKDVNHYSEGFKRLFSNIF
jgi:regulator of sigma E protease